MATPTPKPLSQNAKELRWKVVCYFRKLLQRREILPGIVEQFIDDIIQVSDSGRVFITDHEGDFKYGKAFYSGDEINYLPPAETESRPNAGFAAVSSRADRAGNSPLAVEPGHRFSRKVPDWFAGAFVSRAFVSRAVLFFTKYLAENDIDDFPTGTIPKPRLTGTWEVEHLGAALPIAIQYVIPRGDKPMLAFLDFDDLPNQDDAIIMLIDLIKSVLRDDVETLCLSRKKSSGRYGAHIWLTNVYLPVSEIKKIAELFPGADMGVYTPGHLFRAWPHQKIGQAVYKGTNPQTLIDSKEYHLNEHGTSPHYCDEYDNLRTSCTQSHLGYREAFCERCTFKQMSWLVQRIYAFQIPKNAILSFSEARSAQMPDASFRTRDTPEPPTPYGVFHRLPADHQSLRDIPERVRQLVNGFPRVFQTWQSCVETLDNLFTDIETVFGENVVRQPDGTVVCICQDNEGKVIRALPKSSIESIISAQYCMGLLVKDKCANIAGKQAKELNRSISCGVTFNGKKEPLDVKFDLCKMIKGFLSVGRHLDYIPYNPLLLRLDHGDEAESLVHSNSYVGWDPRDCRTYMWMANKRVDLDPPTEADSILSNEQVVDILADSLRLMRRLFEDPKEGDQMPLFSLWINFLQVRMTFPSMANKLVVPRPTPGNTVPPLCWYFSGDQGTGKSFWLISWLRMVFGPTCVELVHRLTGRFDAIDKSALFGICDELPPDVPNGALINFLKRATNAEQTVERKNVDAQQVRTYHNVCLISNPFSKTVLSQVFAGITFDDRRIVAVRGSRKLSRRDTELLPDLIDPRIAPVWRMILTLGISQSLKDALVAKLPWAEAIVDQINHRVEEASVVSNRHKIFSKWLSTHAPMTALKQDILKAAAKGPQRMVNLFANTGVNMSAGMLWVDGHIRLDENVWDGKYWLRLCSFSSLLGLYRAIAQSSYTDGRFTSGLTATDFVSLLDEDRHIRLTWEEFSALSLEERLDPTFSCTIDETHIYFPSREVARANYEDNTGMVLDPVYIGDIGIPRSPCYSAVGITYGVPPPLNNYNNKEMAFTLEDVQHCRGLYFPHLSFDAVIAAIIVFDLKPEYTLVDAVAQEITDFRKVRGNQAAAYLNAEKIALARSSSGFNSSQDTPTPTRTAKRATRPDDSDDSQDLGIVSTPDFCRDWPTGTEAKRSRR